MTELMRYFSYPFVRYAFAVGVMIALCAALIGVVLVLKRFSFLGDGLSHFAFGVIAAASVGRTYRQYACGAAGDGDLRGASFTRRAECQGQGRRGGSDDIGFVACGGISAFKCVFDLGERVGRRVRHAVRFGIHVDAEPPRCDFMRGVSRGDAACFHFISQPDIFRDLRRELFDGDRHRARRFSTR